jgi:hypothetical protein
MNETLRNKGRADLDPHLRVGPLEGLLAQVLEVLGLLVLVRHLGNVGVVDLQPVLALKGTAVSTGQDIKETFIKNSKRTRYIEGIDFESSLLDL